MPTISPANGPTFVDDIRLPPLPRPAAPTGGVPVPVLGSNGAQALVVGSSLVAASDAVPAKVRQDLVDCTLFAQLAATASADGATGVVPWYRAYFGTLAALGWAQIDTRVARYEFTGRNAEAHRAILSVLAALVGPQAAAVAVVRAAIDALGSMGENRPWLTLFERECRTAESARFQVATAQMGSTGSAEIALAGFSLRAKSEITQVLFFKHASSSVAFDYAAGKAATDEAALATLRPTIARRLAEYRHALVGEIKLRAGADAE